MAEAPPVVLSEFDMVVKKLKLSDSQTEQAREIINKCNNQTKAAKRLSTLNTMIGKQFGSSNQKAFYAAFKPLIK